jgi:two-component system nitrogen regulation sensor histidine kinase NtrY
VAVDKKFEINLANDDATRLLGLDKSAGSYGNLKQLPESAIQREIFRQIEVIESGEVAVGDVPLKIIVGGRQLEILCSAGKVGQGDGQEFGYVFIFEDVTEISIAHQMAAWREVARRIAHEIKNPLTPIKLSAQRLGRLTEGDFNKQDAFDCIQTIVENVESIKRLANEFSNFARMPTAEFTATDLNDLVSDVMMPFVEQSADVLFQVILDKNLPRVELDAEQIRRLLINVIDNAVDALTQSVQRGTKKVVVRTEFQADKGKVVLEIIDNGPGIKPQDKGRIFEPYFTTKKDGTGLGLAIVNSVVADHKGSVRVLDESPQGTKFCITLPVRQIDNRGPRVIKS